MTEFARSLRDYLTSQVRLSEPELDHDTPLFSSGVLDSFAMMELVSFVEKSAGVRVKAREVNLENFDSPSRIVAFVATKSAE